MNRNLCVFGLILWLSLGPATIPGYADDRLRDLERMASTIRGLPSSVGPTDVSH